MPTFSISPTSLVRLRNRLHSEGGQSASVLTEAGAATGTALTQHWANWIRARTSLEDPGRLDRRWFAVLLEEFFRGLGWGSIRIADQRDTAMVLESSDWAEAVDDSEGQPACHFTSGALAEFLTGLADAPIAVLEVECRSAGDPGCIFLAGSAELVGAAADLLDAGGSWREALLAAHSG